MLVATTVATDTRVLREAQCLVSEGFEVSIIGRNVPNDFVAPDGMHIYSASSGQGLRPAAMGSLTTKRLPPHLRAIRWFLLPQHRNRSFAVWAEAAYVIATSMKFDVVHAHDFTALEVGERLSREHHVPFVYDSHEWWLGRQRQYRATPFIDRREAALEKKLAAHAVAVITVGESIADLMRTQRGLRNVHVVRNSFPSPKNNSNVVSPPNGIIYAGRIDAFRELEVIIDVSQKITLGISWMGDHENQWATNYVPKARAAGIEVLTSQSIEAVTKAMQHAGLVFVTHSDQFESHRLALPNKLFHAVHAGVPVIATDVTELAIIVRKYDLGELYDAGDSQSMVAAITRAIARHSQLIANVRAAQRELSWESDAEVLRGIYGAI